MLELSPHIEHAVLFSGDADFRRVVEAVQRHGVRVTVISSVKSNPPMIADELRRQADQFLDLADLMEDIARKVSDVRPRASRTAVADLVTVQPGQA